MCNEEETSTPTKREMATLEEEIARYMHLGVSPDVAATTAVQNRQIAAGKNVCSYIPPYLTFQVR